MNEVLRAANEASEGITFVTAGLSCTSSSNRSSMFGRGDGMSGYKREKEPTTKCEERFVKWRCQAAGNGRKDMSGSYNPFGDNGETSMVRTTSSCLQPSTQHCFTVLVLLVSVHSCLAEKGSDLRCSSLCR